MTYAQVANTLQQMTNLFNVIDDETGEMIASKVAIDSCFPDDPGGIALALEEIKRDGKHICGGGAAPIFKIVPAR